MVDWYKFKLDEIREAPVDSRPRKLVKPYRYGEANKDSGVTITRAGIINPVNYPKYPLELKLHECEDNNEEDPFCELPAGCKPYNQVDYSKRSLELIKAKMKMWLNVLRKLRPS